MNVLSLFDGISTGRLALEMAGVKVDRYMASEIERAPMEISAANWPDIVQLGDVKNIKAADLPKIDLVIGGSPCQGFSRAGRHLNFDDPRSALFFEFSRIVAELRGRNPGLLFMLENVKMKKEWEAVITETMRVQPLHINSSLVSAQNRPRTYWTNIPGVTPPEDRHIKLGDILEPNIDTGGYIAENGLLFDPTISQKARQLVTSENGEVRIKQATRQGYIVAEDGDGINLAFPTSKTRRGRVIKGKSNTLDCACEAQVLKRGVTREAARKYETSVTERARRERWQASGCARVVSRKYGTVVVPHGSNFAALLNAAEVWGCDWTEIRDAEVWRAGAEDKPVPMPHII